MTSEQIATHKDSVKFRMYDDDNELYYEGFNLEGYEFDPLDHFGMPNAGATRIDYFENGRWSTL